MSEPLSHRILTRLLGNAEEINGRHRCPTYLYRWRLFRLPSGAACYFHHFVADDWSLDLHDHPKRFITIGLWGGYIEHTAAGWRSWRAPWLRTFAAEHAHRIELQGGTCWTLVVVLGSIRPWGFWHQGRWVHWRTYTRSSAADERKACP